MQTLARDEPRKSRSTCPENPFFSFAPKLLSSYSFKFNHTPVREIDASVVDAEGAKSARNRSGKRIAGMAVIEITYGSQVDSGERFFPTHRRGRSYRNPAGP